MPEVTLQCICVWHELFITFPLTCIEIVLALKLDILITFAYIYSLLSWNIAKYTNTLYLCHIPGVSPSDVMGSALVTGGDSPHTWSMVVSHSLFPPGNIYIIVSGTLMVYNTFLIWESFINLVICVSCTRSKAIIHLLTFVKYLR